MSLPENPTTVFEMDLDYCTRTFGQGFCGASLEPLQARTNLALWSEGFDNATWVKALGAVTANTSLSPRGDMTADKFTPTAGAGFHSLTQDLASMNLATVRRFSVFLKADGITSFRVRLQNNAVSIAIGALFDLSAVTATNESFGGPLSTLTPTIEDAGGGWYRCSVGGAISATTETLKLGINGFYTADGTSSLLVWGAQLEDATDVSAYLMTEATTATAYWGGAVRKCYNTWNTCKSKATYDKGTKTYKFVTPQSGFPVGQNYIPALKSASGRSGTVNIAGADDRLSALGERATVQAKFVDFADSDTLTDKYQAERITGDAQTDEAGYNPKDRLSFWAKLKARNPNYAGRPGRIIQGTLGGGVFTPVTTRNFILTEIDGPNGGGDVTVEAMDILALADNRKAVAPKAGRGYLSAAITADEGQTITLLPATIGTEYAASGTAVIGSEIVTFTRSGDVLTLTGRGLRGTVAAAHSVNDTVQPTFSPRLQRIDSVISELLIDYAGVDAAFIPTAEWDAECERWAPNLVLTADICKPEGVAALIGEMAILGVSIWWDDVNQKINLKINRPPDVDTVADISDRNNIVTIKQEDRDEDRLTRVSFWSVQIDPTKGLGKDNFLRQRLLIDVDAESAMNYNGSRVKEIYCRWLNQGADSMVRILSKRLINRFNRQPVLYEIVLDAKDDIELASIMRLDSRVAADEAGKPAMSLMQVIRRDDVRNGHTLKVKAQKYQFDQRYGYVTEDTRPVYSASSAAQQARGAYFVDDLTLVFGDGSGPYVFS